MRTVADLMRLSDRKVLLTGGAGQLGLAIGEALIELGATIAVVDRDAAACESRAQLLSRSERGRAVPLPCDLLDDRATRDAVQAAIAALGGLDILIRCAALVGTTAYPGWAVPFEEQTVDASDAALRVNLTAAFVLAQAAARALSVSGHGAICLVGSTDGIVGPDMRLYERTTRGNPIAYGASKGGIIQLTRYLATLLAPAVRVNCVSQAASFGGSPARSWIATEVARRSAAWQQRKMSRSPSRISSATLQRM